MDVMGGPSATNDRGAVMVELALILPILVMLLIGIIDFGRAFNAQIAIQAAAREGARAGALRQDVGAAVDDALRGNNLVVVVAPPAGCTSATDPDPAVVTVSTDFEFNIPFVSLGTRTLSATARMRCGL